MSRHRPTRTRAPSRPARSFATITLRCASPALALLLLAGIGAGCVTVKPVVLDRKTQLENQILGTFQRLEQDLILASSVRGEPPHATLSPLEREAVAALMTREFLRDDLEGLKDKQVLGEANTGLLEILVLPGEPAEARRVEGLAAEENRSRQILLKRVIGLSRELREEDLPQLQRIFYQLNAKTAAPGQKVQLENGNWRVIPRPQADGAAPQPAAGGQTGDSK